MYFEKFRYEHNSLFYQCYTNFIEKNSNLPFIISTDQTTVNTLFSNFAKRQTRGRRCYPQPTDLLL